jgi:hypothetical protein
VDSRILEYIISVPDLLVNGHPVQRIEGNLTAASQTMDRLHLQYSEHDVILYIVEKKEVARFKGQIPIPQPAVCPRGCRGTADGKPQVRRTEKGLVQCSICGFLGPG